jgi:two-component system, NarL family, nitrate/nitrite response regulator NarL
MDNTSESLSVRTSQSALAGLNPVLNHLGPALAGPTTAPKATVLICETQPLTVEGIRAVLSATDDIRVTGVCENLTLCREIAKRQRPDIVLLDKALGMQVLMDWMQDLRLSEQDLGRLIDRGSSASNNDIPTASQTRPLPKPIIWGVSMTEAEALRFLQAGARGILRKTTSTSNMLACMRTVVEGKNWMEDSVFRDQPRQDRYPRSELTPREAQVMELVEHGLKNREIARELGIRPGTVKIHLKHIFEKTGVRGRYGLALTGLRQKGVLAMDALSPRGILEPALAR